MLTSKLISKVRSDSEDRLDQFDQTVAAFKKGLDDLATSCRQAQKHQIENRKSALEMIADASNALTQTTKSLSTTSSSIFRRSNAQNEIYKTYCPNSNISDPDKYFSCLNQYRDKSVLAILGKEAWHVGGSVLEASRATETVEDCIDKKGDSETGAALVELVNKMDQAIEAERKLLEDLADLSINPPVPE